MKNILNFTSKTFQAAKWQIGLRMCEFAGGMDRVGSRMTEDIAYTQNLSRHRNIFKLGNSQPSIDYSFIAQNSTLCGEVTIGAYSSVWYNASLKADTNPIRVGSYSSIGVDCVLHTQCAVPTGVPGSINIGNHCIIDSKCTIFSCIIDDDVFIGAGSIIGEGCKIEKGAIIAPNSFVPHGRLIPAGQLWGGNPVKFIRDLTEEETYSTYVKSYNIWSTAQKHLNKFNQDDGEVQPDSLVASYLTENYFKWRSKQ